MVLHEITDPDDELGDGRERFVSQHVVKNRLEFRDDEDHQESHDDHREGEHDDRINHRRLDLVFDLLRFFLELGETTEDEFEHAAELASFHHVDEELVKNLRMLFEAFGKRAATLHGISELIDCALENKIAFLFRQHIQPAEQRQTGVDQGRELAGKNHQHLGFDRLFLEENNPFPLRSGRSNGGRASPALRLLLRGAPLPLLVNGGRKITGLAELTDRVVGRGRIDQTSGFLAARVEGYVGKSRHDGRMIKREGM